MASLQVAASPEPASFLVQIPYLKSTQFRPCSLTEKQNLLIKKSD